MGLSDYHHRNKAWHPCFSEGQSFEALSAVTDEAGVSMEMKEHPIIFSGEMVKAILECRKTQTRRVIKPQPTMPKSDCKVYVDRYNKSDRWAFWLPNNRMTEPRTWHCPNGQISDRLWVRETFSNHPIDGYYYKATDPLTDSIEYGCCWKPSIHMPRAASRIALEIINIRVERVQEITDTDAKAEGIEIWMEAQGEKTFNLRNQRLSLKQLAFSYLWDSINAKRGFGWDKNPWIWVIEFKKIERR